MKNKYSKPKVNSFSVAKEKVNTIIERDIGISLILFLLFTALHISDSVFGSLTIAVIIVIICEFANLTVRKATEPTAFSGSGKISAGNQASVYANTFTDDYEDEETASPSARSNNPGMSGQINIPPVIRKAANNPVLQSLNSNSAEKQLGKLSEKLTGSGSSYRRKGAAPNTTALGAIIFVIACSIIVFTLTAISLLDGGDTDYEYEYDSGSGIYNSPFYTEDDYLSDKCGLAFSLMEGDMDGLSELDGGSAADLVNMADWSSITYEEVTRDINDYSDTENGFIRYFVETEDGKNYMVAFKFEGNGMESDESAAILTGIAACPYEVWDEKDDYDYYEFAEYVASQMTYAGDYTYNDENILTW